jgi:hypothetical protein
LNCAQACSSRGSSSKNRKKSGESSIQYRQSMPEWNLFKDEYDGKIVNGHTISCIDIDCTDDSDQRINDMLKEKKIEQKINFFKQKDLNDFLEIM